MKYMGSKSRYARQLLPHIFQYRSKGQWYVEPFVGGANMIDKVEGKRIGLDINENLITMFQALQDGWEPPDTISEQEYQDIRVNPLEYPSELVAFVGIGCSYSGKWFGGYARGDDAKGKPRNYCLESKRNLLAQKDSLKGVHFCCADYREFDESVVLYCDPPYANSTKYRSEFNHKEFWGWCNQQVNLGHQVYVSEYQAPEDWICIWEQVVYSSLTKETGSKTAVERLFTKGQNV